MSDISCNRYLSSPFVPVAAVECAARFLSREWGENRSMQTTERVIKVHHTGTNYRFYTFECAASDGSFWFIAVDVHGTTAHAETLDELETACVAAAEENERKLAEFLA